MVLIARPDDLARAVEFGPHQKATLDAELLQVLTAATRPAWRGY
jgi:hypothetical protein